MVGLLQLHRRLGKLRLGIVLKTHVEIYVDEKDWDRTGIKTRFN